MAKLGEGDDRWIVKEREDGTNVHGWHWQEKDALEWSKDRFGELLCLTICDGEGGVVLKTTGVTSCTGEAYVNKRKGKIIPGYELNLKIAYEGEVKEGDATGVAKGNVHFPYIADENADEDPEVVVLNGGEGKADMKVREVMQKKGLPLLLKGVTQFVKDMAAGGPGGEGPAAAPAKSADAGGDAKKKEGGDAKQQREDKTAPLSKKAHTIRMTENFYCRPQDICECLLDPNRVRHFTQSPCEVKPALGPFFMFDGNIHGETVEYLPGEKIVQKWRFRNWPEGHFSKVTITFREPEPGNCFVDLVQENVPEADAYGNESVMDTTETGWKEQIFQRIRQMFGYGA